MNTPRRLAALFATLMVLATAAFVTGVTVEKNQRRSAPAVVFCLGFAILDSREVAQQPGEHARTVVVLAVLTLILHPGAAAVAALALTTNRRGQRTTAAA